METETSPMTFMSGCQQVNSFFFNYISASQISAEISNLKTSKSCGPFSVPIKILKLIRDHVSVPLKAIFNCSISTGTVPDKFKIANVIPIHKQGSHLILNNYRPISLLSVFSGLLERLVYRQLMNFITKYNLLYDKQFGFRSNHSTLFAVLSITDKIQKAIEDGNFSCGIFLDLSKAFDTVNHQILLPKLEYHGIRALSMIGLNHTYITGNNLFHWVVSNQICFMFLVEYPKDRSYPFLVVCERFSEVLKYSGFSSLCR